MCIAISPLTEGQEPMPLIEFSIKPRLCILSEGEEVCRDIIALKWSADSGRSLCLFRNDDNLPLRCWDSELEGEHTIEISAESNIDFYLKEMQHDMRIASREFQIVHDEKEYRRRRRNPWSFF